MEDLPFFKGRFRTGAHHLQDDPGEPLAACQPQRSQGNLRGLPGSADNLPFPAFLVPPHVPQGPGVTPAPLTACPQGPGRRPRRAPLLFERRQRWQQLGRGFARPSRSCWHQDRSVETKWQLRGCGPPPVFELQPSCCVSQSEARLGLIQPMERPRVLCQCATAKPPQ